MILVLLVIALLTAFIHLALPSLWKICIAFTLNKYRSGTRMRWIDENCHDDDDDDDDDVDDGDDDKDETEGDKDNDKDNDDNGDKDNKVALQFSTIWW